MPESDLETFSGHCRLAMAHTDQPKWNLALVSTLPVAP